LAASLIFAQFSQLGVARSDVLVRLEMSRRSFSAKQLAPIDRGIIPNPNGGFDQRVMGGQLQPPNLA
jgi:hypothetical protein